MIAHPVIGSGIETLLKLEQRYDVRRVASGPEAAAVRDWRPDVALIDGTLLSGGASFHLTAPTLVLSGNEADGRALLRRLPEGQGWLRKDATAAEFTKMIDGLAGGTPSRRALGTLGTLVLVLLVLALILLVIYLIWLALY